MTDQEAYRGEARELLVELEASLLELEQTPEDQELIGRVFRALHTIKGSGAMFGFDQIAAFTHDVENAFDLVRAGRLAVSPELIGITLAGPGSHPGFAGGRSSGGRRGDRGAAAGVGGKPVRRGCQTQPEPRQPRRRGSGRFAFISSPRPDCFLKGTNPLLLLRELARDGARRCDGANRRHARSGIAGPGAVLHLLGHRAHHGARRERDPRRVSFRGGRVGDLDRAGRGGSRTRNSAKS